jgi:hypothetical protein
MKRDMDLVRELLLKLEALPMRRDGIVSIPPDDEAIAVEGYDVDQIDYHLSQIRQAGWIDDGYPSGGGRLAVRARVSKGVTVELALRSRGDGWEGSRGRTPTALEQG